MTLRPTGAAAKSPQLISGLRSQARHTLLERTEGASERWFGQGEDFFFVAVGLVLA